MFRFLKVLKYVYNVQKLRKRNYCEIKWAS